MVEVSIPFKRERLSEQDKFEDRGELPRRVSIPFKRERLSERFDLSRVHGYRESFNSLQTGKAFRTLKKFAATQPGNWFQFPSNGKGFPNKRREKWNTEMKILQVSIPFKRERLSERNCFLGGYCLEEGFQFPSNGKGFPNKGGQK